MKSVGLQQPWISNPSSTLCILHYRVALYSASQFLLLITAANCKKVTNANYDLTCYTIRKECVCAYSMLQMAIILHNSNYTQIDVVFLTKEVKRWRNTKI